MVSFWEVHRELKRRTRGTGLSTGLTKPTFRAIENCAQRKWFRMSLCIIGIPLGIAFAAAVGVPLLLVSGCGVDWEDNRQANADYITRQLNEKIIAKSLAKRQEMVARRS